MTPQSGRARTDTALPEVCTEGDTEAEALAMAKDAIEVVIASRLERGELS